MKSIHSIAAVLILGLSATSLPATEWYVATTGDDSHPGSKAEPFATLARAQRAARQRGSQPATILLRGGTYYLDSPIVLTAADSGTAAAPVLIAAMPGEQVTLSGGLPLQLTWRPLRDGIFQAEVPHGIQFDQLFVDGQRQPMARYPNYDPTAQYFQGFAADCTAPQRVAKWAAPEGGFVHAMHRSLWGDMHWQITGKTPKDELKLVGGWQNNRQMGGHREYRFVENIFEELDAPGEWYLDTRHDTLYFYPPDDVQLDRAKVEAVRLAHLIELRGDRNHPVRHITLRGLTLTHTARTFMANREPLLRSDWTTYRGGAVLLDGAEACAIRDCRFDQVGGNAIFLSNYNRRIEIRGCHIASAGASGISFAGDPGAVRSPLFEYHQTQKLDPMDQTPGPKTEDYPADCLVDNCLIERNGRVEKQTAGVNIYIAESITVRHCSIYDCPRAGINICSGAFGGHLIELCDVFDTVKETGDHGSFNSWGRDRFWDPDRSVTVEWVKQHPQMPTWDCRKTIVLRHNRWRCDHGWDIDLDDGSSNYEIDGNLCLAGGIKLREGYFRNVHDNIIVNWTFCPHVWYPDCQTRFRQNIVWQDRYRPAGMRTTDQGAAIDNNLVHEPGGAPRPAVGLQKFGSDAHSLIGDAMFVDPLTGDYRIKEGSPARKLGFSNSPMDRFGVQRPDLKAIARRPVLPGTLEAAAIASSGWDRRAAPPKTAHWHGATLKAIEDTQEMSAVGLGDTRGVLLAAVPDGSPAARFGLQENDVIRGVNGAPIRGLADFARRSQANTAPKRLVLELWRNQEKVSVAIPRD
jgi:hypothetical protein